MLFVNHVFGINAKSSNVVFLRAEELRSCWLAFFGTRSASVLTTNNTGSKSGSGNGSGSGHNTGHKGYQRPPPGKSFTFDNICRRYNANMCPNQKESRCKVPGTEYRLFHLCNRLNSNNVACRQPHTAADH